jgi:hypothetical protein
LCQGYRNNKLENFFSNQGNIMDHFVEDVGVIRVSNGMVFVECVRRSPAQEGESASLPEARGNLVMPIGSFVRMFGSFSQAIDRMVELKILQRRAQGQVSPEVANSGVSAHIDDHIPKGDRPGKNK